MIKSLLLCTYICATAHLAQSALDRFFKPTNVHTPSMAGFSGASAAHKKGNYGQGQTAIVIELGMRMPTLFRDLGASVYFLPSAIPKPPIDHYELVINQIQQVVPKAAIIASDLSVLDSQAQFSRALKGTPNFLPMAEQAVAINLSLSTKQKEPISSIGESGELNLIRRYLRTIESIARDYGKKKLVVVSAGNDATSLSLRRSNKLNNGHLINNLLKSDGLRQKVIVVGSIDFHRLISSFSATPGQKKSLQDIFIMALGENIPLKDNNRFGRGTSASAPTVTGAILLIKAAYPKMSIQHVKEAILESASKDFYVDHSKFYKKQKSEGVFVYSTPRAPDLSSLNTKDYRVLVRPFNPELYGQGVLDIDAALKYAELRNLYPSKSKIEIKDLLNKTVALRQKMAAQTIQKAIRKWKVQKSARQKRLNGGTKSLSSMEKDNSLT